jgi:hypothetical protein
MGAAEALRSGLRRAGQELLALDPLDLAARLTLLDLLLHPVGRGGVRTALLALAAGGLLLPRQLRARPLWLALAALTALRVVLGWPVADNHAYLLAYWCLAIFLALGAADAQATAARAARLLVGLTFALASLWKLALAPDYLDGRFLHHALLTDPRLVEIARLASGASAAELGELRAYLRQHVDGPLAEPADPPPEPPRLRTLAALTAPAVAALEAAVAIAFLWPGGRWLARARDPLLLAFCAGTYAVTPVEGFGWLLLAMGAAQCAAERRRTRVAYVLAFLAILLYRELPWVPSPLAAWDAWPP